MSACPICNRACNRDGSCAVCHGGGPFVGDTVEWYSLKAGGSQMPAIGKVTALLGEQFEVRSGKSGKGKKVIMNRSTFTRVTR